MHSAAWRAVMVCNAALAHALIRARRPNASYAFRGNVAHARVACSVALAHALIRARRPNASSAFRDALDETHGPRCIPPS